MKFTEEQVEAILQRAGMIVANRIGCTVDGAVALVNREPQILSHLAKSLRSAPVLGTRSEIYAGEMEALHAEALRHQADADQPLQAEEPHAEPPDDAASEQLESAAQPAPEPESAQLAQPTTPPAP